MSRHATRNLGLEPFLLGLRCLARMVAVSVVFVALFTPHAMAQGSCCSITAINRQTGIVTAKVNASGQILEFKVTSPALLPSLKDGQPIYANFTTRQVSLDGKTICGTIVAIGPATSPQGPMAKPSSPSQPGAALKIPSSSKPGAAPESAPASPASATNTACCGITKIDAKARLVDAKDNSTSEPFEFTVPNSIPIQNLHDGHPVWANFKARKVSLDGKAACCDIVNLGKAGALVSRGNQVNKLQQFVLPKLALGPLQTVKALPQGSNRFVRSLTVGNTTLVHLHGLDGIKQATGLPQGVQDFLFLHARTLPPNEVDNYIVNVQLAQDWFQKHPEPDYVKQAAAAAMGGGDSHAGCNVISMHCLGEAAQHVEYEAARQSEALRQQAGDEWKHITGQVENELQMVEGCLADHTLDPADGSFQLSLTPQFPLSFEKSGNTTNSFGRFSGQISGNLTFGVPMNGSFNAQLQVSYIPCLPFFIRPKSINADGTLGVGATLDATLNATGQFQQSFTVPPGGTKIPVYVIPVVIGGVPIAELDVSVYLDGTVVVDGNGSLNGAVHLQGHEETAYQFNCGGGGCNGSAHRVSVPDTATESVQVQGRIHVRPAVYAALQLDLDFDLLSARAGPEPYLYGEIYGCAAASGSQSTGGASTSQDYNALTADVDWGLDLRAEAFAGTDKLGENKWRLTGGHLLFKDLAHSNALIPVLAGMTQPPLGQPAAYKVKMPACYPYTDQMKYQIAWTGGATATGLAPAANPTSPPNRFEQLSAAALVVKGAQEGTSSPPASCTSQSGQAECWTDPLKDMPFSLAWPAAGSYNLTIMPMQDKHGRKFDSSAASQTNISVQQPAGGSSSQ